MSKINKVIAGLGVVAGLGVALAPVATFAETAGSDTVNIQVNSDCAIKASTTPFGGTFAGEGTPGQTVTAESTGTSTVVFDCSTNSRVTVSASSAGLSTNSGVGDTIAATALKVKLAGSNGVTAETAFNGAYGALNTTETQVAHGTDNGSADMTLTVASYQAVLKADQTPGAYTGTVDYTWALESE